MRTTNGRFTSTETAESVWGDRSAILHYRTLKKSGRRSSWITTKLTGADNIKSLDTLKPGVIAFC